MEGCVLAATKELVERKEFVKLEAHQGEQQEYEYVVQR